MSIGALITAETASNLRSLSAPVGVLHQSFRFELGGPSSGEAVTFEGLLSRSPSLSSRRRRADALPTRAVIDAAFHEMAQAEDDSGSASDSQE